MTVTRRDFVKTTSAAVAAMALPALADPDPAPIRIGVVGCGGRGTGAAEDCLNAAPNVALAAMGDLFPDRLAGSRKYLESKGHAVPDARCFTGFDAYRRVLDLDDVDLVLFATPPGFRPLHVAAAVDAGKHVFMEKPVAVDPVGVRTVRAAGKKAAEKGLAMVAGTQYRHHRGFLDTIAEVHAGRAGALLAGRAYYNIGRLWHKGRKKQWSEMEWQLRNWYYLCWLSGDHIVEQHIHTIDVCNWVMGGPPERAVAVGGRLVRSDPKFGNIYDHFAVDYEYEGGVHVTSMCRQIDGCANHVGAYFRGTKGEADPYRHVITGTDPWTYPGKTSIGDAYRQEHTDLIASVRAGAPLNETEAVCDSTLTAILGREAAYTGQQVTWDEMTNSDLSLVPEAVAFGPAEMRPVPLPGVRR